MAKYIKNYTYKGYKIKQISEGKYDLFNPSWDANYPILEEVKDLETAKEWINSDIKSVEESRIMKENNVKDYLVRFNEIMNYGSKKKRVVEYSFGTRLSEEDADPNAAANPNTAIPADPNAAGAADTNPAAGNDTGAETSGLDSNDDSSAMDGADATPMEDEGEFEDIEMDDEGGLQPGDNVVDVSQITDSQQQTNDEMQQLKDKFEQMIQASDKVVQTMEKLAQTAEDNQKELQNVKDDLAQRVPTEIEKLKGRKTFSEPFGNTVDDYWKNRPRGDKYDMYPDNEEEEQEYVLRKSDIENINPQTVYNSFNQKLSDLVKF